MSRNNPAFLSRIFLVWGVFFKYLFNRDFAGQVTAIARETAPAPTTPPKPQLRDADREGALQLLGLLQQEGRFIDFVEENVAAYSDAQIGAAARVVHEGCRKVVHEHFQLEPVRAEEEGSPVTLEAGFDASAVRLTGNVVGEPPFRGTLTHRGWRATAVSLPKIAEGHDLSILAAAEVEL